MATFTIIRVYEVPADTQQEATDRMMEALTLHVERDFHVKDKPRHHFVHTGGYVSRPCWVSVRPEISALRLGNVKASFLR